MLRHGIKMFLVLLALGLSLQPRAGWAATVFMEDMTWMEIRERIQAETKTVIVPTGGLEQNGPHLITGKHNIIVRYAAGEIAKRLSHTLVASVINYVPQGRIDPPEGHMMFPGTLSVTDDTFTRLLEDTAASLKQHGFTLICFIGDHGGSQEVQQQVADRLTREWENNGVRVLNVADYYMNNGIEKWVQSIGLKVQDPGAHAGLQDTSELMALDARAVRNSLRGKRTEKDYRATGSMGDSTQASANYGKRFLTLKIDAAVNQISHAASR